MVDNAMITATMQLESLHGSVTDMQNSAWQIVSGVPLTEQSWLQAQ